MADGTAVAGDPIAEALLTKRLSATPPRNDCWPTSCHSQELPGGEHVARDAAGLGRRGYLLGLDSAPVDVDAIDLMSDRHDVCSLPRKEAGYS